MTIGFVYILTNRFMYDVYKIGCTERSPHLRADELSKGTGVPAPFKVLCYAEVWDFQEVEQAAHGFLSEFRISPNREFFHHGLVHAVRFLYWNPRRLSFSIIAGKGEFNGYIEGAYDDDGNEIHVDDLLNPWAPPPEKSQSPQTSQLLAENGSGVERFDPMVSQVIEAAKDAAKADPDA